jgi:hypothetical protein
LDDGVVDTFGSVSATRGAHTSVSVNASDSGRIPSGRPLLPDRHHGMMDVLAWNGASSCDGVPPGKQPKAHSPNSKFHE